MSTYSYTSPYLLEQQRKREEWERAPRQCPHCNTPINQGPFSAYGSKVRSNCGATACRSAAYRQRKAARLQAAREAADERINRYAAQLPPEQAAALRAMRDVLMCHQQSSYHHGHEQALAVLDVIEAQRCKHDRIQTILDYAAAEKRRAEKAEEHKQALEAEYKRHIAELEAQIKVYQTIENAVHKIANDQRCKQPDPPAQPTTPAPEEGPDRAGVLATLEALGMKPYTGQEDDEGELEA